MAAVLYCPKYYDHFLEWPPTPNGTWASLNCPTGKNPQIRQATARKFCTSIGLWGDKNGDPVKNASDSNTNYQECIPHAFKTFFDNRSETDQQVIRSVLSISFCLELFGNLLSIISSVAAICIFARFRTLKNRRTSIHKNLLLAILLESVVVVIILSLEAITVVQPVNTTTSNTTNATSSTTLTRSALKTEGLCQVLYAVWEYFQTCVFLWMLVEGIHIHNLIAVSVFPSKRGLWPYHLLAWGFAIPYTFLWALLNEYVFAVQRQCWRDYRYMPEFWILNSLRLLVFVTNIAFLFNVIRVLVMRLKENFSTEVNQVRLAVRAAILLLPLLGATNFIQIIQTPDQVVAFAIMSLTKAFFQSFQGFFISLLYCFLNKEVRNCLRRSFRRYRDSAGPHFPRRYRFGRQQSVMTTAMSDTGTGMTNLRRLSAVSTNPEKRKLRTTQT